MTAAFSGGPTTFTLDPGVTLVIRRNLHADRVGHQVSDQDGNDPPDNMVMNFVVGFTAYRSLCRTLHPHLHDPGQRADPRRSPARSRPRASWSVTSKGRRPRGFYLQDLTGDGDPATSDGIFVYTGSSNLVSVGQVVRVTGFARERFNQTTLNGSNSNSAAVPAANIVHCGTGSVTADRCDPAVCQRRRPRALRGHARALPAVAGHRRILQL